MNLDAWLLCSTPPATVADPAELRPEAREWIPAVTPGTVAAALQKAGIWTFDDGRDLDAGDWWFRTSFAGPTDGGGQPAFLCFDGLATEAEVWLNGQSILRSDNMFRSHWARVDGLLKPQNDLCIVFRSLHRQLKTKRPRPRWKTNLVVEQQLRWHRTSLLGRIPGWSPPAPAIGPWRGVRQETGPVVLLDRQLHAELAGDTGVVRLRATVETNSAVLEAAFQIAGQSVPVVREGDQWRAEASVPHAPRWWPHTHGDQPLFPASLVVRTAAGEQRFELGAVGFRTVLQLPAEQFGFEVNGREVYCRGACWTIGDMISFSPSGESLRRDLQLARDAGVNMLRVGGTMTYESELFYRLCDELGILVWQDFPFANMDYPFEDDAFRANVEAEVTEQTARIASHPSLAVFCGNSEIEQQIAMLGMPREAWELPWFTERLPALCAAANAGTPYVRSSPSGGDFPFHNRTGVSHYYGIGAYQRLPHELRKADVRFTSECLGFANIPEPEMIPAIMGGLSPAIHHPRWKRGVPRDTGPGWDFEDVRDFYLRHLFQADPVELRSFDMTRYLQLGRVTTGEMMAQTFAEWRSASGNNRGGLVWFYKDLRPGAGWGIIDSLGNPKAAYYFLKRSWRTLQLLVTDEGLEGLRIHLVNETASPVRGTLEVVLIKDDHVVAARGETPVEAPPGSVTSVGADAVLGRFCDVTHSYRFGPPGHDVAIATLYDENREVLGEAFYFVPGRRLAGTLNTVRWELAADSGEANTHTVSLQCDRLLQYVTVQAKGYLPDDNYFHLAPGRAKVVRFQPVASSAPAFKASVEAFNLRRMETIKPGHRLEN